MKWMSWGAKRVPASADPNVHIQENLRVYLELPHAPFHAIMLEGPWGGGKTYLVKKLLSRMRKSGTKHVFVSLYGVASRPEFDRAVLTAAHPFIANRAVKASLQLISGLLSAAKFNAAGSLEDYLKKFDADVFIFDDLERCEVPLVTVLGYVNPFVEHAECKVILIANEREIAADQRKEYDRRKEKVVGRTLSISPDLANAIPVFLRKIKDRSTRRHLRENAVVVDRISMQSGSGNLRVIQQSLWDYGRLYRAIPDELKSNKEGMAAVLALFLALSIEIRTGAIGASDLETRSPYGRFKIDKNDPPTPLATADAKYPGTDLYNQLLDNDLVIQLFIKGRFDPVEIARSLTVSPSFASLAQVPSWRILWDRHQWQDDEVRAAMQDVETKFTAHAYTERGEVLHVIALRLYLVKQGIVDTDAEKVAAASIAYVDELEKSGRLAPYEEDHGDRVTGHQGLGFMDREAEDFQRIRSYFLDRQRSVLQAGYPAKAAALLAEMVNDRDLFWRRINYSNTGDTKYAHIPIFTYVGEAQFVAELLKQSNMAQFDILRAFLNRYEHGALARDLAGERQWVVRVRDLLLAEAAGSDALGKSRLTDITNWTLGKVLRDLEASEAQQNGERANVASGHGSGDA